MKALLRVWSLTLLLIKLLILTKIKRGALIGARFGMGLFMAYRKERITAGIWCCGINVIFAFFVVFLLMQAGSSDPYAIGWPWLWLLYSLIVFSALVTAPFFIGYYIGYRVFIKDTSRWCLFYSAAIGCLCALIIWLITAFLTLLTMLYAPEVCANFSYFECRGAFPGQILALFVIYLLPILSMSPIGLLAGGILAVIARSIHVYRTRIKQGHTSS